MVSSFTLHILILTLFTYLLSLSLSLSLNSAVGDIKDVVVAQIMTALTRELQEERLFLIDA